METPGAQIAEALGLLSRRDVRQRVYDRLTHELGEAVNEATYPVLSGLARYGSATAKELADALSLDRSVVSRHASTLESAGLITRSTDPRDARWTQLTLTERGADVVSEMRHRLANLLDDFLDDWPAASRTEFAAMLRALTKTGPFAN